MITKRQLLLAMAALTAFDVATVLVLRLVLGPKSPYGIIALPINLYVGWIIGRTFRKW